MSVRRLVSWAAPLALGVSLVALGGVGGGAQAAPKPGTVLAPPKVTAAMLVDFGITEPAKCFRVKLAKSDKRWGIFDYVGPAPTGCTARDGLTFVHKVKGTWQTVPNISYNRDCASLKRTLVREAKAPLSVYRDFKAAGYCA